MPSKIKRTLLMTPVRPSRFFGSAIGTFGIAQEVAGEDILGRVQPGDAGSQQPATDFLAAKDRPRTGRFGIGRSHLSLSMAGMVVISVRDRPRNRAVTQVPR